MVECKIYLDVCCLNRPFDDWSQERIRIEGEAVLNILHRINAQGWQLIMSETIAAELEKMSDLEKLENIREILNLATTVVEIDDAINIRSQELELLGFGLYDAFHVASAERIKADVLLTTDDRLLKKASNNQDGLRVKVSNPVNWLMTIFQQEGGMTDDTY
ncbi:MULTISPECIES: type II toxin-antitoxin system VapC family toxin [Limnospira]|uniref:PIN domain-containing protein n=4 Tax=Limnospira TaxID=2596745 RepID=A0A9P1KA21_9CYAN|nr:MULTISPECIES: PIN domain-containing protein [Limnospira]MDC0838931.1 PIN domain-containing protein [Limnoraphis robusta]RAQ45887.1 PIN domain-containing protein [Arthrospira sp. O9.13F]UWU51503.1 putative nucleic acid-binding protein, contains PIN domain [Arthrospira platensis C1]EDZ92996.1 conserved hypothetical protein [Limnospira maxima CS-328]CDM92376.1 conserved hypothetical protein [Limnospira indica PCC 8005]